MDNNKPYIQLLKGREGVQAFFAMVSLPHNLIWLADSVSNLISLFDIGNGIMMDEFLVYGKFSKTGELVGIIQGMYITETDFRVHVFSKRKTGEDIANLGVMIQKEIKRLFSQTEKISGAIPEHNTASQIYALRNGFKKIGVIPDLYFIKDGKSHNTVLFEKEI